MSTTSDKKTINEHWKKWLLDYINISIKHTDECSTEYNKTLIINEKDYTTIIGSKHCSHAMNYLLYNLLEIDSVIPYGYLADDNWMGCVILKETIDKHLRRKTVDSENIPDIASGCIQNLDKVSIERI